MNKVNYQKELDKLLSKLVEGNKTGENAPTLLLHSCCAPCSSYVLEYLSAYFRITVYYYNPNITAKDEYRHRADEQRRLIDELNTEYSELNDKSSDKKVSSVRMTTEGQVLEDAARIDNKAAVVEPERKRRYEINFIEGAYEPQKFIEISKGLENEPEGGKRCFECYRLRLASAVEYAETNGFDYVTTTLSISPLKNAAKLNEIGLECTENKQVSYLCSDFKKREGYKRSIELSREHNLYRQDYCGCGFSKQKIE